MKIELTITAEWGDSETPKNELRPDDPNAY